MQFSLRYWRRCLRDFLRYGSVPGRVMSRVLALCARLPRDPLGRLGLLTRAARVRPTN